MWDDLGKLWRPFPPVAVTGHPKWWFGKGIFPKSPDHSGLGTIVNFPYLCMFFYPDAQWGGYIYLYLPPKLSSFVGAPYISGVWDTIFSDIWYVALDSGVCTKYFDVPGS